MFSVHVANNTFTYVEESSLIPAGSCLLHTASRKGRNDSHTSLTRHLNSFLHSILTYLMSFFRQKAEALEVILGRTFRKQNSSGEQIFKVEKYWIHEKFDKETFDNDIGE